MNPTAVSGEVKQTLASLKGVSATLVSFASIEENPEARDVLYRNMQRINGVIEDLEKRVRTLEFEEPQYKGF